MTTTEVKISDIKANPNNPRLIKDEKFKRLVESVKTFPEMLRLRPIVVNEENVIIGGNMRWKAAKEAGYKTVPVTKAVGLTEEQEREFIIKDNVGFGEWDWDWLANQWDVDKLEEWGVDIPDLEKVDRAENDETVYFEKSLQVLPKKEYIIIIADEDSDDWNELKSIFKCKTVRQGGCSYGSTSDKATTGLERVFNLQTFKNRVLSGI